MMLVDRYAGRDKAGAVKLNAASLNEAQCLQIEACKAGDWSAFEKVVVFFSGGKDSLAVVLTALAQGCPREKLELWHHDVDGREGEHFFDWPVTADYCRVVAAALGVPLLFSWKRGGLLGEMSRNGSATAPSAFELADGSVGQAGGRGPAGTRLRFPAQSDDLSTRWCSSYLKIDVAARAFANDPRFARGTFLALSGERREESSNRARYAEAELHRSANASRSVVQWRNVIDLDEAAVWELIRAAGITPHPAYQLGFGRLSCAFCVFGGKDQLATARDLLPQQFERIASVEEAFGHTMKTKRERGRNVPVALRDYVAAGTSWAAGADETLRASASATRFSLPVLQEPASWQLPAGAFRATGGPG